MNLPRNYEFQLLAELDSLFKAREIIREFLNGSKFSGQDKNRIVLSIDEVLANIVEHGVFPSEDSPINFKLKLEENTFFAEILDESLLYDPGKHKSMDPAIFLSEGLDGGMGIYNFMRLMNVHHQERVDKKGNHLFLSYPKNL
jgi:serine/threonine-protein kinase RsbW